MKSLNNSSVDRTYRPVKVLQFGEGNFLRAFVDWMLDVANSQGVIDTSVAVVSPRFRNNAGIQALKAQNGLYHVCLEGMENGMPSKSARLITCVSDAFSPVDEPEKYDSYLLSPDLRFIVSNTTEAGIRFEPDDIMSAVPATFPGKVASLLYKRYKYFNGDPDKGLIFLCCELIEDNGSTLREYVLRHAEQSGLEPEFMQWVRESCIFCDTLVDRIVPGFPHDSIEEVKAGLGYDDNLVVKGELYHIWAIGGEGYERVRDELPLDKAGLNVLFMPTIKSFRDKKVRILNGSHTGMVPVALMLGCETVMDAFNNPDVNLFINTMVEREVIPMIEENKAEVKEFADGILERFYNPYIRHFLKSIALNSLSKWEVRNFPTVLDVWNKKKEYAEAELFTFAALMALYAPDSGFEAEDNESHLSVIHDAWSNGGSYTDIVSRIVHGGVFVKDFEELVPGFSAKVGGYLANIKESGMADALKRFLKKYGDEADY